MEYFYSKYTGEELEERLDRIDDIPELLAEMLTGKNYTTPEDALCIVKKYVPTIYENIPIDNNTIYWANTNDGKVLKARIILSDTNTDAEGECLWEKKTNTDGKEYLYSKLPVITAEGITMYADGEGLDIPSIYAGIPFDGVTIHFNKEGKVEVIGGTEGGVSNFWDLNDIPSWITNTKPTYSYSEIKGTPDLSNYVTKSYVDDNFVTFTLDEVITGIKSFTNGLKIGESSIKQLQEDVVYIDANLVVRGGVTMYYDDGEIDIPNIKDQIGDAGYNEKGLASFDQTYFTINNGHVSLIEGAVGLNEDELLNYLTNNQYATQSWVESKGFALNSDLTILSTKVNDFLEGSDTDNIINKWKELEAFLTGLDGSNDLATILSWKADKSYVDDTFVSLTKDEDVNGKKNFVKGLSINGVNLYNTKDDIVYLEGNLVVKGGVTMYALDDATVDSIIDSLPIASTSAKGIASFDGTYFVVDNNGKVTLIPDSVGLNEERLYAYLTSNKYATQDWVEAKKYLQTHQTIYSLTIKKNGVELGVYTPNSSSKEIDIVVPTKVSELDNDSKFISGITSAMVVSALGYTPYDSAGFTKANIKSTLNISDWALATSKPSYKTSEVTEETNLYFTNARAVSALKSITDSLATDISTKWTQNDTKISNWDTAYGWGDHSKQDYTTNTYVNDTFVTIGGNTEQIITGAKNFTGGLKVNGSPITYDKTNKYWKLEGDLLVTGGVTMYGNDSDFVASTIMDAIVVDNVTIIKQDGKLVAIGGGTGGGGVADSVAWGNVLGKPSWITDTAPIIGISGVDVSLGGGISQSALRTALGLGSNAYSSTSYLPLSGGTLTGSLEIKTNSSYVHFKDANGIDRGSLGVLEDNNASVWKPSKGWKTILDADNYSSYALPLSGGTLTASGIPLTVDRRGYTVSAIHFQVDGVNVGRIGIGTDTNPKFMKAADGTWKNIALTDSNVASATKLATARTIWGRSFDGTGNVDGQLVINASTNYPIRINQNYGSTWTSALLVTNSALTAGQHYNIDFGYSTSAYNAAWVGYYHAGVGSTSNRLSMGLNSVDDVINILGTGNVGIGTTSPDAKLHIVGDVNVAKPSTVHQASLSFMNTSSDLWQISGRFNKNNSAENDRLNFYYYNGTTWSNIMALHNNGNMLVSGGITMYSARKLKTIQDERGLSLEELSVIKPTRFTWKDGRDGKVHIGGIADDVQKVLPEVIYKADNDTLTMDYGNAAFAIAASLIKPVITHEEEIKALKDRIKELEEQVKTLSWNIA